MNKRYIDNIIRKSVRRAMMRRPRRLDRHFCDVSDKSKLTRLGRRYVVDMKRDLKRIGAMAEQLSVDMTYREFKSVMPKIVGFVGGIVSNLRKLPASIGKA